MNFNLRDFLIHIVHGGIIILTIFFAFCGFNFIENELFSSILGSTLFVVACYLVGLFLDPLADLVDTLLHKWARFLRLPFHPSYDFLNKGECRFLRLAHNKIVRNILSEDAKNNDPALKSIPELWEDKTRIMLLFNYAKNRAFKYGTPYQLGRIDVYFNLFIFYRNLMVTTFICTCLLLFSNEIPCKGYSLIPIAGIILMILFYHISYKYRTYYCRMILGAVYSPQKAESETTKTTKTTTDAKGVKTTETVEVVIEKH
jgi:hypothetical protein